MLVLSFDVGIVNLAYCLIEHIDNNDYILDWNIINCSDKTNEKIIKKLINELDKLYYLLDVNIILIEKQPSFNRKMGIIGNSLYIYFMIRTMNTSTKVINYSPVHKLNCTNIKPNTKSTNKYQINKRTSVEHTRYFIKNTEWVSFFEKMKKKDDLADCYLQGKSYFLNK